MSETSAISGLGAPASAAKATELHARPSASFDAKLAATEAPLTAALDAQAAKGMDLPEVSYDEASFRLALNEDAMATEKLAEGIRAFCADAVKLEDLMKKA